jgi:hypothetical protein
LIERLPFVNEPGFQRALSLSLGQNIYTPEDLKQRDLIEDDRPYAGITYLALGFHSKNARRMDSLEFDLGMVGPHSYAEQCQETLHQWFDATDPQGWDNQLKDEPVANIFYERKWKLVRPEPGGFSFDVIPHLGGALGTTLTYANAGAQIRWGWNLPNDFGTFRIRPACESNAPHDEKDPRFFSPYQRFGIHLFAAVSGSTVLRNIFLDGNTFRESHSVDKELFVADLSAGISVIAHRFKISYAYVYRTREYETQNAAQIYGSLALSFTY